MDNIEMNQGVASFAENGRRERAWHRLGRVFDRPMTVEEAITASHADYEVGLREVIALTPDIQDAMAKGDVPVDLLLDGLISKKRCTMRMDRQETLGIVSKNYGVVQNADAFRFIDTICTGGDGTPVIECAGVLGRGERVFITAKFPDKVRLDNKGDDMVEMYVVFTTSHDGFGAVNCMVTPIRVVCNNTLNIALHVNEGKLSLRHTSQVMSRLDLTNEENVKFAVKTMNMYSIYKRSLEQTFEHLRNVKVSEQILKDILAEVIYSKPNLEVYRKTGELFHEDISTVSKNTMTRVMEAVESGVGQDYGERGTGMWLVNGLTTYYQNEAEFRSDEQKFDSLMVGTASQRVQKAVSLLV